MRSFRTSVLQGREHVRIYGAVGETTVNGVNYLYLDRSNPVG